jgi:hypothetical protein
MRGKIWFVTGVGVGYVLGTRAGRERFEQMVSTARKVWESPTVQEAAGVVQAQANKLYEQGKQTVNDKLHKVSGNGMGRADDVSSDKEWDASAKPAAYQSNAF